MEKIQLEKSNTIQSITEAYSMQPSGFSVTKRREKGEMSILEIEKIIPAKYMIDGKETSYYEGFNYNGDLIFRYLANSVNVYYYPKPK